MLVPSLACRAVVLYDGASQTRQMTICSPVLKRAFTFQQMRYDALIDTFAHEVPPPQKKESVFMWPHR
jgi:hypothetical protein